MRSLARALHAAGLALGLASCGGEAVPAGILLVTVDGLRPDALGVYGAPEGATPALDAFAREALVFEDAITPAPLSLPAHASLLTGLDPRRHGAREDRAAPLGPDPPLLGQRLAKAGWTTAAGFSGSELGPGAGLERGFERVDAPAPPGMRIRLGTAELRADQAVARALDAIDALRERGRPFLYALQLVDPRPPFAPPAARPGDLPLERYAGEVAFVDAELGRLFDGLRDRGLWEGLYVVVTAPRGLDPRDEGHLFGEDLAEEALRVPLLLKAPSLEPGRVGGTVSLVDVVPTLLALLGLEPPPADALDGTSLVADGAALVPAGRVLAVECRHALEGHGAAPWVGVVRDELKLVRGTGHSMLDRHAAPALERELYRNRDARSEGMRTELEHRFGALETEDARRTDPALLGPRIVRLREAEADLARGRTGPPLIALRSVLAEAPEDAVAAALAAGILLAPEAPGGAGLAEAKPWIERLRAARPEDPVVLGLDARHAGLEAALLRREVLAVEFLGDAEAAARGEERVTELRRRQLDALRRALAREPMNAAFERDLKAAESGATSVPLER